MFIETFNEQRKYVKYLSLQRAVLFETIALSKLQASKNVENRAFLSHLTAGKAVANNLSASVLENVAILAFVKVKRSAFMGLRSLLVEKVKLETSSAWVRKLGSND